MTYASANRRPNPAALTAALGIPGAIGALLVVGLAVTVVTVPDKPNPEAREISKIPLPPPPPPVDPQPRTDASTTNTTIIPMPKPIEPVLIDVPIGDTFPTYPGPGDLTGTGTGPVDLGIPGPTPTASLFDAVGARAKGNPGRWVTNDDYRTRWILEEMAGTARFNLAIDARGKVTGCTITRSTGHAPLDTATCDLVTKRARFDAARDGTGKPVAGNYTGVITWQIPK